MANATMYKMIAIEQDVDAIKVIQDACTLFHDVKMGVISISNATIAIDTVWKEVPSIIVIGPVLPDMKGVDVIGILKKNKPTQDIPIVMLADASASPEDEVHALATGAEDFIRKPLNASVLKTRIEMILKRNNATVMHEADEIVSSGKITLNMTTHTAYVDNQEVVLTPKEFALLYLFIKKENRVLNRVFLSETIWEQEYATTSHTIDKHIANLRKKIGDEGQRIVTLPTIGYKFVPLVVSN